MTATYRSSGIQTAVASSYVVSFPAGAAAGDLAVIFITHAFDPNNVPTGWALVDRLLGSFTQGQVICKILTSGDVSTGSVTVTVGGSFNGGAGCALVTAGTFNGLPSFVSQRNSTGSTSISLSSVSYSTADLMLYWGANRGNSTDTVSIGTQRQQINDGANFSACLYSETPAALTQSPTFQYSSAGSGNYQIALCVETGKTVPAWVQGADIQTKASGAAVIIAFPAGSVAGDTCVIFYGGAYSATTPTGWAALDNVNGTNAAGLVAWKVLDATDILTGSVTVTLSGSYAHTFAVVTIKAASVAGYASPIISSTRANGSRPATRTLNITSSNLTDFMIWFGFQRSDNAAAYPGVDLGFNQGQLTDAAFDGACLSCGSPASVGTITSTFRFNSAASALSPANHGDYIAVVNFAGGGVGPPGIPMSYRAQRAVYIRQ